MNLLTAPFCEATNKTCSAEKAIAQAVSQVNGLGVIIFPQLETK